MKKRILLVVCACALVVALSIAGTVAWLTDKTESTNNTFTVGNINIELSEEENDLKMVPGTTVTRNPVVTVKGGSEDCYLFIKATESENLDSFISYEIADGWTKLKDEVYYREQLAVTAGKELHVLKNNNVSVKDSVTKEMMDSLTDSTKPTLTFTAYAVQKAGMTDASDAWAKLAQQESGN